MSVPYPDTLADGVIESLFDSLSQAIDKARPEHETLFLAKLVLLMTEEIGDPDRVAQLIDQARVLDAD